MKTRENIEPDAERQAELSLYDAILTLKNPAECEAFFRDLCTPAELQAMADRWRVVAPLERGMPYREIHDLTGVSVTTIGRVARFLEQGHGGYRAAHERVSKT